MTGARPAAPATTSGTHSDGGTQAVFRAAAVIRYEYDVDAVLHGISVSSRVTMPLTTSLIDEASLRRLTNSHVGTPISGAGGAGLRPAIIACGGCR